MKHHNIQLLVIYSLSIPSFLHASNSAKKLYEKVKQSKSVAALLPQKKPAVKKSITARFHDIYKEPISTKNTLASSSMMKFGASSLAAATIALLGIKHNGGNNTSRSFIPFSNSSTLLSSIVTPLVSTLLGWGIGHFFKKDNNDITLYALQETQKQVAAAEKNIADVQQELQTSAYNFKKLQQTMTQVSPRVIQLNQEILQLKKSIETQNKTNQKDLQKSLILANAKTKGLEKQLSSILRLISKNMEKQEKQKLYDTFGRVKVGCFPFRKKKLRIGSPPPAENHLQQSQPSSPQNTNDWQRATALADHIAELQQDNSEELEFLADIEEISEFPQELRDPFSIEHESKYTPDN